MQNGRQRSLQCLHHPQLNALPPSHLVVGGGFRQQPYNFRQSGGGVGSGVTGVGSGVAGSGIAGSGVAGSGVAGSGVASIAGGLQHATGLVTKRQDPGRALVFIQLPCGTNGGPKTHISGQQRGTDRRGEISFRCGDDLDGTHGFSHRTFQFLAQTFGQAGQERRAAGQNDVGRHPSLRGRRHVPQDVENQPMNGAVAAMQRTFRTPGMGGGVGGGHRFMGNKQAFGDFAAGFSPHDEFMLVLPFQIVLQIRWPRGFIDGFVLVHFVGAVVGKDV